MVAAVPNRNFEQRLNSVGESEERRGSLAEYVAAFWGRLRTVPNFRPLYNKKGSPNAIFRSSRPDLIGQDDLEVFNETCIKSIIDFRSKKEYLASDGNHLLDQEYHLYHVKFPKGRNYRHDERVEVERISGVDNIVNVQSNRRHYLINFFTLNYIWEVFNRAPWYIRLYSLCYMLIDFVCGTGHKHFVRLFARTILNSTGIIGQYKDMIEFSQRSICAALKLMSVKSNLPALLNCAHGKDRTGIVSALVLSCLGKSPDYIAAEYALSHDGLATVKHRMHKDIVEQFHMSEEFITAKTETMHQLFDYIKERYGSVEGYMEYIGFGPTEQRRLRSHLMHEVVPLTPDQSGDVDCAFEFDPGNCKADSDSEPDSASD